MTVVAVLWPLGMIHTPRIVPARSLQLYSTAGAKPTFQLFGDACLTSGPSPSRPTTLVRPQKSASTSNARTHSLLTLYAAPAIRVVLDPGLACPRNAGPVPK